MSAAPKLTEWLPGTWWPGQHGVYQREYRGLTHYSRWDGRFWYSEAATVESAADMAWPSRQQMLAWRGLAEPPR